MNVFSPNYSNKPPGYSNSTTRITHPRPRLFADNEGDMTSKQINLQDLKMAVYEGLTFTFLYGPVEEHVKRVKSLEIRDDDIILSTFPRSGTHWIFRVLDMLSNNNTEFRNMQIETVSLDYQLPEDLGRIPSPRILHSHVCFKFLPDQIKIKRNKIVHVFRNPKAIAVSTYLLSVPESEKSVNAQLMEHHLELIKSNWPIYMDEAARFMKEHPEVPVFNVSYEEMTDDSLGTIKKLAKFLGLGASEELCIQIEEACRFDNQKMQEDKMNDVNDSQRNRLFRFGKVSTWKEYLTVAQSEAFDTLLKERRDRCVFSAKYTE